MAGLSAELENVARLQFKPAGEPVKRVNFKQKHEYVTSNPVHSDISQKLQDRIDKLEQAFKEKEAMSERSDFGALTRQAGRGAV